MGTSRAFNKVIAPILTDPGRDYPEFLKKIVDGAMSIAEGDLSSLEKDRFTRAFVITDRFVDVIKPEILHLFSLELSKKMSKEDPDKEVPEHYIEDELKSYINDEYDVDPKIPLKSK